VTDAEGELGEFWTPQNPDNKVSGRFSFEPGADAEVELEAGLVDDPCVKWFPGGMAMSASAADSVKAFQPIVLQGQLDSGELLTLVDARNHGGHWPFSPPRYVAHACLVGAHVSGEDQLYHAARFRIGHPYWLGHLASVSAIDVGDDGSKLSAVGDDDGNWLLYQSGSPLSSRQFNVKVVYSCVVLVELALHQQLSVREVQFQVPGSNAWLPMLGEAFSAESHEVRTERCCRARC
jgi:hypothetical protein